MIGIKRKTNNNQSQSSRAASPKKTAGSRARSAAKSASTSKSRSKHSSRTGHSSNRLKSIASEIRKSSREFIKEHGIEDSIKSALIEFIKKYKF